MRTRLTASVLVVVALLSGGAAVAVGPDGPRPPDDRTPVLSTGVLSPRRVPGLLAEQVGRARLAATLDGILADQRFGAARPESCLVVEEADEPLYAHQADKPVIPASTLKLVTAVAALRRLGGDHRFVTEVRAPRAPQGGVVEDLWLIGGGDPLLATAAYAGQLPNQPQTYTSLEKLADEVRDAGVTEVRGRVLGDASGFDDSSYLPTWKPGYVEDSEVGPVSALVVNDNFTVWRPKPVATSDPAAHGASTLAALLVERGVRVGGPGGGGRAPERTVKVASIESPPLTAVVAQMLGESDNVTAEMLVKALGARFGRGGSWTEGLGVIRSTLAEAGYPVADLDQHDGSGLERDNRLTCRLLMQLLDDVEEGAALHAGLPVAGETGTLRLRLADDGVRGKVRAKTGALDHVAGLVGYVESAGGTLEFALVGNGLPRSLHEGRAFADAVARALVGYPAVPDRAALEPLPAREAPS